MRILVAEDHDVARVGLKQLLTSHPGWEVCAEAKNGHDAVRPAQKLKPDLVVMDVAMPELNGLEATRKIREILPRTQVVILTVHFTDQLVRDIVEAGARGYIIKSDAGARTRIGRSDGRKRRIVLHVRMRPTPCLDRIVCRMRVPSKRKRLTPREREIAQLLAEGKTSKEVAVALRLSVKTVETHRANLMRKLELHSVSELVRYAIKNQIIES